MKDNSTGKDKEFYELGKKIFDRLNPPGTPPFKPMNKPCPTCEALARTVMLDQTSHDTTPPQRTWVGLTDEEIHSTQGYQETREMYRFALAVEAKLKEKNYD